MAYGLPDSAALYYATRYSRYVKGLQRGTRGVRTNTSFNWTITNVLIYDNMLRKELQTPAGGLWRYMQRAGQRAVTGAKVQAGVRTGALRMSIHMKHLANATGQYVWVGSNKSYAYIHHEGSRPHIITPSRASTLRFTSGSRVIYTHMVRHPGTRPNRYLSSQMKYFFMSL